MTWLQLLLTPTPTSVLIVFMFSVKSYIMIVDDSAAIRTLINQQLSSLGFKNIIEAEEGTDALAKLDRHYQDKDKDKKSKDGNVVSLLIIDWKMPGLNGLELLRKIKQHSSYKNIPVLMI